MAAKSDQTLMSQLDAVRANSLARTLLSIGVGVLALGLLLNLTSSTLDALLARLTHETLLNSDNATLCLIVLSRLSLLAAYSTWLAHSQRTRQQMSVAPEEWGG